jgi:PncC family amidohydrolase
MIEDNIHHFFIKNNLSLGLAESSTGGGAAARLVQIPGCSLYFLGSVVAYSRGAKERLLGVDPQIITSFGEVSVQTTEEMAKGALKQFGSDFTVAITGIAGPTGGSVEKPVGTTFFAIASQREPIASWRHTFQGSRQEIISQSIESAFAHLWKYVNS